MSLRNLVFASLFALPLGLCAAQSTPTKPVEPTSVGVIYRLDPSTAELKPLPDEAWKQSQHIAGFNTLNQCAEVKGERSSFRIRANENIVFVFKTGSPEKVSLYRFVQKGKNRRFDYESDKVAVLDQSRAC